MNNSAQPPIHTDPESARNLALSTHYLRAQDFGRALHYSRLTTAAGNPEGVMNLLLTLVLTGRHETAAEMGALFLAGPVVHHTYRKAVLNLVCTALYHIGARDNDCSAAYSVAAELAEDASLNPERVRWRGQQLHGKTLLLTLSEGMGGFGDHVMWARFVPLVAELGPRIVVQCGPLLGRLFETLPGVVSICDYEDRPSCDFAIGIQALPHALGLRGVPTNNPFDVAGTSLSEETHSIGISWGASWVAQFMDRKCSLAEYVPLSAIPSVTLYSLQKGADQKQLYPPPAGFEVHDLAHVLTDFLDTAKALMSMDAVVTTDNVVANLACMLGRPTFVLVPKCADWRWGVDGRTPWYPSARVYQQDVIGEWGEPIARLVDDLHAFLKEHGKPLARGPKAVEVPQ